MQSFNVEIMSISKSMEMGNLSRLISDARKQTRCCAFLIMWVIYKWTTQNCRLISIVRPFQRAGYLLVSFVSFGIDRRLLIDWSVRVAFFITSLPRFFRLLPKKQRRVIPVCNSPFWEVSEGTRSITRSFSILLANDFARKTENEHYQFQRQS